MKGFGVLNSKKNRRLAPDGFLLFCHVDLPEGAVPGLPLPGGDPEGPPFLVEACETLSVLSQGEKSHNAREYNNSVPRIITDEHGISIPFS